MTKQDALCNVMDTLTSHRAMLGGPREIAVMVYAGEVMGSGAALCGNRLESGWSKSAINNNSQTVFLIVAKGNDDILRAAQRVIHGADVFEIDTAAIRSPEETGYWLLPVKINNA